MFGSRQTPHASFWHSALVRSSNWKDRSIRRTFRTLPAYRVRRSTSDLDSHSSRTRSSRGGTISATLAADAGWGRTNVLIFFAFLCAFGRRGESSSRVWEHRSGGPSARSRDSSCRLERGIDSTAGVGGLVFEVMLLSIKEFFPFTRERKLSSCRYFNSLHPCHAKSVPKQVFAVSLLKQLTRHNCLCVAYPSSSLSTFFRAIGYEPARKCVTSPCRVRHSVAVFLRRRQSATEPL
jgi:hypothetical protein